jgi:hypothetical protein
MAGVPLALVTTRELREFEDVFLVEHVWTFERADEAAMQLSVHPQPLGLVCASLGLSHRVPDRMAELLPAAAELAPGDEGRRVAVRLAARETFAVACQYSLQGGDGQPTTSHYLLDTVGCHALLNATEVECETNFALSGGFVYMPEGGRMQVFNLLWPTAECEADAVVRCPASFLGSPARRGEPLQVPDATWDSIEAQVQQRLASKSQNA